MKIVSASTRQAGVRGTVAGCAIMLLVLTLSSVPSRAALAQQPAPQEKPAQSATAEQRPLPLSPIEIAEKNGTAVKMSLRDVTRLALQNNLDIAIQDTNEELAQQRIIQAYGPYDPTIGFNFAVGDNQSPNTRLDTAAANATFNETKSLNWTVNYAQAISTGGTITGNFRSSRAQTNQLFSLLNPIYGINGAIQFTQPLWRNFRIDQTRGNIKLVNLNLKISDSQFKQKVVSTISNIQGIYWDLVGTIRNYEIQRESVRLGQISLENNRKKVEIGTLAPISITESEADLANREVSLIQAEERIINVENNLRALISSDRSAEIWRQIVVPTDTPEFKDYPVALDEAIETALSSRPELEQLDLNIQQNDVNYSVTENSRKWQMDFVASFGSVGNAGTTTQQGDSTVPVNPDLIGGLGQAYKTFFVGGYNNWSLGVNVQIPLRNRTADAQLAQIRITQRQLLMNRKNAEQQIQVAVRNAVQSLETNKKQVQQARVARQLAEEQLVGEEKRFQAGLSENFLVLQRQNQLSSAQGQELQALITYKQAIIDLQTAMYTLLEANDFQMAKESTGGVTNVPKFK